jgi:hypothetical protein
MTGQEGRANPVREPFVWLAAAIVVAGLDAASRIGDAGFVFRGQVSGWLLACVLALLILTGRRWRRRVVEETRGQPARAPLFLALVALGTLLVHSGWGFPDGWLEGLLALAVTGMVVGALARRPTLFTLAGDMMLVLAAGHIVLVLHALGGADF